MGEEKRMAESFDLEELRKVATCVFLAAEKEVAEDIAKHIMDAADEISHLRQERDELVGALSAAGVNLETAAMVVGKLELYLRSTGEESRAIRRSAEQVAATLSRIRESGTTEE